MEHSFFHKLIIAVVAGAVVAGGLQFYKTFVVGADRAIGSSRREWRATRARCTIL